MAIANHPPPNKVLREAKKAEEIARIITNTPRWFGETVRGYNLEGSEAPKGGS